MNKMSEVFFVKGNRDYFLKNPDRILDGFKKLNVDKNLKKKDFAALKIHFGEKGNKSYINPTFLTSLVKFLKHSGARPFLFETNTLYRGDRMNAIDHTRLAYGHGFGKLDIPIIIGDGIKGNDCIEVEINKKHFKKCYMAAGLADIDYLFVLSHFTGHMLTGFGAALKNLGMGCAARRGKLAQHCQVSPKIKPERCIACGVCAKNCSVEAIEKDGDKYKVVNEKCIGCAQCISVCPTGAADIVWSEEYNLIGEKMAEYAYAATLNKRAVYANFLLFITRECDCMNKEDNGFIEDIGVLFSNDPIAIDKASIDLILNGKNTDVLKDVHPQIDYLKSLNYAQDLGFGCLDYKIIEA